MEGRKEGRKEGDRRSDMMSRGKRRDLPAGGEPAQNVTLSEGGSHDPDLSLKLSARI